uniref:Uncharacterized protein n=1 Tax=Arundo donax TaxID=35708 RepID=A0A0A8YZ17_ARUDO
MDLTFFTTDELFRYITLVELQHWLLPYWLMKAPESAGAEAYEVPRRRSRGKPGAITAKHKRALLPFFPLRGKSSETAGCGRARRSSAAMGRD